MPAVIARLLVTGQLVCAFASLGLGFLRVYSWPASRFITVPCFDTSLIWIGGDSIGLAIVAAALIVVGVFFRRPVLDSYWMSLRVGMLAILAVEVAQFAQTIMIRWTAIKSP